MINSAIRQKIIIEHLDGTSNREIARRLNLNKDTVRKYVNIYDAKLRKLLETKTDAELLENIQDLVSMPKYSTNARKRRPDTLAAIEIIKTCLEENAIKLRTGRKKQQMKKNDIHEYLLEKGLHISYTTVKRLIKDINITHEEAYIRQEYTPGNVCEFDWGTVKLNIGGKGYRSY